MREHESDPCERLLREWHFRCELVNSYYRSLQLLMASNDDDLAHQQGKREELSEKLDRALLTLRHISDQLDSCERHHAPANVRMSTRTTPGSTNTN